MSGKIRIHIDIFRYIARFSAPYVPTHAILRSPRCFAPLFAPRSFQVYFHVYLIAFFASIDYNVFVIIKEKYYNIQNINLKVVK